MDSSSLIRLWLLVFFFLSSSSSGNCSSEGLFTLDSLRDSLTRQEDSIVFSLIERAKYPYNSPTYTPNLFVDSMNSSLMELFARETERLQAQFGRYQNPEVLPFFPDDLPSSLIHPYNYSHILYDPAASVNVSKTIWNMYFNDLLPLFTTKGDDGNYGLTSASDLVCLQLLSRRIHYGRFVAEVKFREAPQDYVPAIRAQDKDALMKLVTVEAVEETVRRRVEKKARVFGQNVSLDKSNKNVTLGRHAEYKVNPMVASTLYKKWVIPLTKVVEVEYLLHRLDCCKHNFCAAY